MRYNQEGMPCGRISSSIRNEGKEQMQRIVNAYKCKMVQMYIHNSRGTRNNNAEYNRKIEDSSE